VVAREKHDRKKIYCRKLGHHLTFHYCRTTESAKLCPKIVDCWFDIFDVRAFLEKHCTDAEMKPLFEEPAPKVLTLIDLIEKARRR